LNNANLSIYVESNFIEGGNENVAFERARGREGERERGREGERKV
jgi:hypothetical protein